MRRIKKLIFFILILCISVAGIVTYNGYKLYKNAIQNVSIEEKVYSITSRLSFIEYDDIPEDYVNATIAIEDHRYREHGAVDLISIGRSIITNIIDMSLTEGGSTITQQVAKNMYFTQEKKFTRKIAEIFVAFDLEDMYSKDDIIALYINDIYFGNGYKGLKQASNGYFDKQPYNLTLDEITILAGIPNAPSVYALNSNPDLALQRQNMVIDAMYTYKYITKEQADELKK